MSVMGNINYIEKVFAHPCAADNIPVLIQTAFPAAAVALLEVFQFGCRDIQKMRAGKTPWHSKGLTALLKNLNPGVQLGPKMWGFAIAFAPVEAALQYWLFVDVATGFIANWMSMVYQVSNCTLPSAGYIGCGVQTGLIPNDHVIDMNILCTETRPCVLVGGTSITIPAGCSATISWQLHFEPFLMDPQYNGTVTTWLEEEGTGTQYSRFDSFKQSGVDQGGGGGAQLSAPFPGAARVFKLKAIASGGIMFCNHSHVSVSSYGRPMKVLPTGCKPVQYDNPYPHKPVPHEHEARHARPGNFFGVGGTIGGH